MKIKRLILSMLLVLSLVPLYVVGGLMIVMNKNSIVELENENLEALSNTIVMNIETYLDGQRIAMRQLAYTKPVQQALDAYAQGELDTGSVSYEYMYDLLADRKLYDEYIVSVAIADRDFSVLCSSEGLTSQESGGFGTLSAVNLENEFFVGRVYAKAAEDGAKTVVLACHRIEKDGVCIGYVLEEIDTSYFDMLRYNTTLTKDDIIYIRDGVGGLITAGRFGKRAYSESAHRVTDCEAFQKKWNAINHKMSTKGSISFKNNGIKYITYYSDITNTEWLIQVTVNMSTRNSVMVFYAVIVVLSLLCVTVILIGANYLLTRRITQPLDRIASTLSDVQEHNDYSLRIHVAKKGELGAIAEQINHLLEYVEAQSQQDKQKQKQLERDVELDPLTGILNKKAIHEDMHDLSLRAKDLENEIMIGFVDVDNFRDFNTRYGHQIGDEVLKHVAASLRRAVPGVVGRNGGDEFIFCMLNRKKNIDLVKVMEVFYESLKEGVPLESGEIVAVTCSVGIIHAAGSLYTLEELEKFADTAMYEAKNKGKNTYHIIKRLE